MANSSDVLRAVQSLSDKLYASNGFQGDIPEMKKDIKAIHDHLDDHSKRLVTVETQVEERTKGTSKKAIAGYSGGGLLVLAITILQILQLFNG